MQTRIIAFDIETIPDPHLYEAAVTNAPDWAAAMRAAEAGDRDGVCAAIPDARPGNRSKPDALMAWVDGAREEYDTGLVKGMSVDPTQLAICSAALFTVDPDTGEREAIVTSLGTTETTSEDAEHFRIHRMKVVPEGFGARPLLDLDPDDVFGLEHQLLGNVWYALEELWTSGAVVATFNGDAFDVRALLWRSMRHAEPLDDELPYGISPSVDLTTRRYDTRPHLDVMQVMSGWDRSRTCSLDRAMPRFGIRWRKPDGMDGSKVYAAACDGRWREIEDYNIGDTVPLHEAARQLIAGGLA